jgi:hypothetical protein
MEMSFPFDIATCTLADGHLDHTALLALAISRQASGPTARMMLNSINADCKVTSASPVDPLAMRIGYFSSALNAGTREITPSGGFYVAREKCTDHRFQNNESAVYQDVSANRKQNDFIECISEPILAPTGQENLRHI